MKKYSCLLILILACNVFLYSQHTSSFYKGYILRGLDTIHCQVMYNFEHSHAMGGVRVSIEGDEVTFAPGSIITGFGVYNDSVSHHYGVVSTSNMVGNRSVDQTVFLRKLVAGRVSLFEDQFRVTTTKKPSFSSPIEKPTTTSSQTTTQYYISKSDPAKPKLNEPVVISGYRKKELEKYIGDNESLYNSIENTITIKDVIRILEEYNSSANKKQ